MTIDEIVNGSPDFPGLIHLIRQYLDSTDTDLETRRKIDQYLRCVRIFRFLILKSESFLTVSKNFLKCNSFKKLFFFSLIQGRASGELWTLARFMREFVQRHPEYQHDSVVNEKICYDLMKSMNEIAAERARCPRLNGLVEIDGTTVRRNSFGCKNCRRPELRGINGNRANGSDFIDFGSIKGHNGYVRMGEAREAWELFTLKKYSDQENRFLRFCNIFSYFFKTFLNCTYHVLFAVKLDIKNLVIVKRYFK